MRSRNRSVGTLVAAVLGALLAVSLAAAVDGAHAPAATSDRAALAREPIDLVWISDSVGWGVAPFYARRIRKDLGVVVRVEDRWEGGLSAAAILTRLRTRGHEWIPLIRDAEVIFVSGNPIHLVKNKGGDCVSDLSKPPVASGPQHWARYIAGLKAIYARIFAIRQGRPVILRTGNWYVPVIAHAPASPFYPHVSWEEAGLVEECTRELEALAAAIAEAAAAYRVPVADVYTAFNGKSHRQDPVAKGYIQADGIHVNNRGRAVVAKTLADLGYRKVTRPR